MLRKVYKNSYEIDNAVTTFAPAASKVDSGSQAILKLHHPSGLDYKAHYGLVWCMVSLFIIVVTIPKKSRP